MLIVTFTWNWIEWGQMCRLHYSGHILCILCSENKPRQKIQKCPLFARVFMEIVCPITCHIFIHFLAVQCPGSIWPFHWVSEGLGGEKKEVKVVDWCPISFQAIGIEMLKTVFVIDVGQLKAPPGFMLLKMGISMGVGTILAKMAI